MVPSPTPTWGLGPWHLAPQGRAAGSSGSTARPQPGLLAPSRREGLFFWTFPVRWDHSCPESGRTVCGCGGGAGSPGTAWGLVGEQRTCAKSSPSRNSGSGRVRPESETRGPRRTFLPGPGCLIPRSNARPSLSKEDVFEKKGLDRKPLTIYLKTHTLFSTGNLVLALFLTERCNFHISHVDRPGCFWPPGVERAHVRQDPQRGPLLCHVISYLLGPGPSHPSAMGCCRPDQSREAQNETFSSGEEAPEAPDP